MKSVRLLVLSLCSLVLSIGSLAASGEGATIVPPLHTEGYKIVDSAGNGVRLTSANWYGFDQKEFVAGGLDQAPLEAIIGQIRLIGVNSVRLPWANETLERDPIVPDYAVAATVFLASSSPTGCEALLPQEVCLQPPRSSLSAHS